jgi:hypothetical protein
MNSLRSQRLRIRAVLQSRRGMPAWRRSHEQCESMGHSPCAAQSSRPQMQEHRTKSASAHGSLRIPTRACLDDLPGIRPREVAHLLLRATVDQVVNARIDGAAAR